VVQDVVKDDYSHGGAEEKGIFPIIPTIPAGSKKKFPGIFVSRLAHLSVFSFYYNCVDMEITHRVLVKVLTLADFLILVKYTILFWLESRDLVILKILCYFFFQK
jgi:hypothetical protein